MPVLKLNSPAGWSVSSCFLGRERCSVKLVLVRRIGSNEIYALAARYAKRAPHRVVCASGSLDVDHVAGAPVPLVHHSFDVVAVGVASA
jgi:hypothetical protein